jgi:hypothetical protein
MPPSGVSESCIELTAPQEVPAVADANIEVPASPKRVSFPSMLMPCTPSFATSGLPPLSAQYKVPIAMIRMASMTARRAHPWRGFPAR